MYQALRRIGSLMMLCVAMSRASSQTLATTRVDLSLSKGGDGSRTTRVVAAVTSADGPVYVGEVIFTINGADCPPTQVVGLHPAIPDQAGTATLVRDLPKGSYNIGARYGGTVNLAPSVATKLTVNASGFSGANLSLAGSSGTYQFDLTARESLQQTVGTVELKNVSTGSTMASVPVVPSNVSKDVATSFLSLGFSPSAMVLADLFSSGEQQLVISDPVQGRIDVFAVQGSSDQPEITLEVGTTPTAILVKDFDCDGLNDIAVLNAGGGISILFQDPAQPGSFKSASTVLTGGMPSSFASGDFNGDGLPDLAVVDFANNSLTLFLNQTSTPGTFLYFGRINTPGGPTSIIVGDLTGVGTADCAITSFYEGSVLILMNDRSASGLFTTGRVYKVGRGPTQVVNADFNGDGLQDLAVSNSLDGTVSVLPAIAGQQGQFPLQHVYDGFVQPVGLKVSSIEDAEAPANLAVADASTGEVTRLQNDGSGNLSTRELFSVGETPLSVDEAYSFSSGTYLMAVIDGSMKAVHLRRVQWSLTGTFSGAVGNQSGLPQAIEAQYISKTATAPDSISNVLELEPTQLEQQNIHFSGLVSAVYGSKPIALQALATSGLAVQFSVVQGAAYISGSDLIATGPGKVVVQADQPGNADFAAASPVQQVIYIAPAPLVIVPTPAARAFGGENPAFLGSVQGLVGSDLVDVRYSSSADTTTAPGYYREAPLGISATVRADTTSQKYVITSSVGVLTILPDQASTFSPPKTPSPITTPPPQPPVLSTNPPASEGGNNQSTLPKLPAPRGGPIVSGPTNPPGSSVPQGPIPNPIVGPGLPVNTPTRLPIPVFGTPVLHSPLPGIGVEINVGGKRGSRASVNTSQLLLLQDLREKQTPGLIAITLTLSCSLEHGKRHKLTLAREAAAIATLDVLSGQEFKTRVPRASSTTNVLSAHFAGSSSCAEATSGSVTMSDMDGTDLTSMDSAGEELIQIEVADELLIPQNDAIVASGGQQQAIKTLGRSSMLLRRRVCEP